MPVGINKTAVTFLAGDREYDESITMAAPLKKAMAKEIPKGNHNPFNESSKK